MNTLLLVVCFIGLVGLLIYLGSSIISYDEKRKNNQDKPIDTLFSIIRWILYIPLGICSGLIFNIIIAVMMSSQDSWFISGTIMQLIYKVVSLVTIGFCFYVIIPLVDRTKKLQSAAITLLILVTLILFGHAFFGQAATKSAVLEIISTLLVFGGCIYAIVKPDNILS